MCWSGRSNQNKTYEISQTVLEQMEDLELGSGRQASGPATNLAALTCDPVLEQVYRAGLLSVKELRSLTLATQSEEIEGILRDQARATIARAASALRTLRRAGRSMAERVAWAAGDAERRLVQLEIPMNLVHPSQDSPLLGVSPSVAEAAQYDAAAGGGQVLLSITHPAAWWQPTQGSSGFWDMLAASGTLPLKPCLVLMLAEVLPAECRAAYLRLPHAAYAVRGAATLGDMLRDIIPRMMTKPYGPQDVATAAKRLGAAAPALHPFTLSLLRHVSKGRSVTADVLASQRTALSRSLGRLLDSQGHSALYCPDAWRVWLLELDAQCLVSCYLAYLTEGFQ